MYKVASSEISVDGEKHISYGIDGDTVSVNDISTDREKVEQFAELCNRLEVSEVHLLEVVEDFVSGDI